MTNKKGDKKGNKQEQKGVKTDTVTNKKGNNNGDKEDQRETSRTE